ncbi:MAG: hypothetical protein IKJ74_01440 [Clostridia bacterium]|nr:hypothetical protein [Clostridia bacterium]
MLKIGWSTRDVSTNAPVLIGGQACERISIGSKDPTTITVLVLDDGKDSVIFLSGDFTAFRDGLILEVKEAVSKANPAIDPTKIILNATHTHTAPRYALTTGYDKAPRHGVTIFPPEKYRAFLLENMVSAVCEAYETRSAGSVAYGFSTAEIAVQRRCVYFNDKGANNTAANTFAVHGHGMMYGKTDLDDFSGYEGCTDATVSLLFTFDETENLTGAIVNVPCPSQCTEHEVFTSADYWNEARAYIREKYGNIFILPQCAAAGDLSPHRLHQKDALKRRNRLKFPGEEEKAAEFSRPVEYYNRKVLGERIAAAFDEGYSWAKNEKLYELPIVHKTVTVPLEAWKLTDAEYENAKNNYEALLKKPFQVTDDPLADHKVNTTLSANLSRYETIIERYEKNVDFYDTELHVLKLGDIAFASCPFELYLDYQHRIQGRSPFEQVFMIQLAATSSPVGGYLPTEKAVKNKGYSAISFSCSVSPQGGQTLVETVLSVMREIR